jgi:hypothetical protein
MTVKERMTAWCRADAAEAEALAKMEAVNDRRIRRLAELDDLPRDHHKSPTEIESDRALSAYTSAAAAELESKRHAQLDAMDELKHEMRKQFAAENGE